MTLLIRSVFYGQTRTISIPLEKSVNSSSLTLNRPRETQLSVDVVVAPVCPPNYRDTSPVVSGPQFSNLARVDYCYMTGGFIETDMPLLHSLLSKLGLS